MTIEESAINYTQTRNTNSDSEKIENTVDKQKMRKRTFEQTGT